jgi:hypothetical protein
VRKQCIVCPGSADEAADPCGAPAAGCMLVEMATGQPLFPGDSDTEQLWLILQVLPLLPVPCTADALTCVCSKLHRITCLLASSSPSALSPASLTWLLQCASKVGPLLTASPACMLQCLGPLCPAHQARLAANPLIAGMAAPRRRLSLARRFPDFDTPTLQLLTVR